jgi:hypothetical protein
MTGMFVWAAGRWVYDCSQATPGDKPQMRTMMNPPKALATARFQAFKFDENTFDVPAIQFMFLAAASGGYISYKSIKDTDYEFIVDLPLLDFRLAPFPIGHTPEFPHNTIVLRPRLLKKVEQLGTTGAKLIQPIVELLPPQGTTQARQVKVTVPMSQLSGDPNAAGFLLSMGWSDPVGAQANKVKRCVLEIAKFAPKIKREDTGKILKEVFKKDIEKLKQEVINKVLDFTIVDFSNLPPPLPKIPVKVTVRDIDNQIPGHPVQKIVGDAFDLLLDALANILPHGDEEWQLHYGFNGHWKVHFQKPVNANKPVPFPLQIDETDAADKFKFDVRLAEGDLLFFAANGMELQPLGDMMRSRKDNRVITLNDKVVVWKNIVSPPPDAKVNRRNMVFQYVKKVMLDSTSTVAALGMDNSPLGYIDPNFSARGSSKNSNPMVIKDPLAKTDATQRANFARAIGEEAIVVEDSSILDYEITYHIEIKDLLGK